MQKQSTSIEAPGFLEDDPDVVMCKGGGGASWACGGRRTGKAKPTLFRH